GTVSYHGKVAPSSLDESQTFVDRPRPPVPRRPGHLLIAAIVLGIVLLLVLFHLLPNRTPPEQPDNGNKKPKPALEPSLDRLTHADIPEAERFDGLPGQVVAVIGERRWRHWGPIHALAFSPDGTRLASGGEDRVIRV